METKEKIKQRHKNYVEYYENNEIQKKYTLTELMDLSIIELMGIMPNNQCYDEYNEALGYYSTKHITGFEMHKIIDGSWNIGYYEGHRDTKIGERFVLFEIDYVKDLKIGLIDLFLMVQNRNKEIFNGIKSGRIEIPLGESWDNPK